MESTKKQLSDREIRAFVNLLQDSEEKTLNLMAQQVRIFDDFSLRYIDKLTEESEDVQLIDNWYYISKLSLINQMQDWRNSSDLETGLFLISRLKAPGILEEQYRSILDAYSDRVAAMIGPSSSSDDIISAINTVLFMEEAYIGNQADYYDLNNNFLHTVIDTKTGNPIMLSCIYILLARRLGLDVKGIGTPGHFIIQFEDMMLDPFFGGREVTKDECVLRAQELSVLWREEYLEPINDKLIISRCIRNLIAIYKKLNDYERAQDATNILKLV